MHRLVISDDEGKTTVVPLVRDEITIGRREGNTIRLTERNVSRRHARLVRANGAFLIEDLASHNGVRINGRRINQAEPVMAGDRVSIGDYLLGIELSAPLHAGDQVTGPMVMPELDEGGQAVVAPAAGRQRPARLVMLSPPSAGTEFPLSGETVRIGREESLDIWVNHRSISREHAEVSVRNGTCRVRDLESSNGVRVNGVDVTDAALTSGDVVDLGQVRFRFVGPGETYAFDADRTVQMEPLHLPTRSTHWHYGLAAGIVGMAVIVAGVFVLGGEDTGAGAARPAALSARTAAPRGAPAAPDRGSALAPEPSGVAAESSAGDVERCTEAVSGSRYAEAIGHAEAALRLKPGDPAAVACKASASLRAAELEAFERGVGAMVRGDIDEAYFAFEELAEDSALRQRPDVAQAMTRFAHVHVQRARALVRTNPEEAERHAGLVLSASGVPLALRVDAQQLHRDARARGASGRDALVSGRASETASREAVAAQPEPARTTCNPAEPDYSRCVIRVHGPRAGNPRELAMVIEAYRALGNTASALGKMEDFVRRYPAAGQAEGYRQILARHGQ